MKKKYSEWDFPRLALLFLILVGLTEIVLNLADSGFLILVPVANALMFSSFLLCLFITLGCCYYLLKILTSKCCCCNKRLENRTKKAFKFLLTPPWKKRKMKLICQDCQKTTI